MNEANLTTRQIIETFDKNTTLKARAILSDYFKKSLTVSGKVLDVSETFPRVVAVRLRSSDCPEHRPFEVTANFTAGPEIIKDFLNLVKGEFITVRGLIDYVTAQSLNLRSCELINGKIAKENL